MARRPTRKSSNVETVDFSDVPEGGGGGFRIPEGEYTVKVDEVKKGVSSNDNEQFEWIFKGVSGKAKGKTFYFYTPLVEQALWKLRETLTALGLEVPEGPMDIDLDELTDLEGVAMVEDDEYKGKIRSKISGFVVDSEVEEEDEEEETTKKKPAGKGKKALPPISEDEVKAMSEDELEALVEKYGLDVDLSEHKILRKKVAAVTAELEEKELLEAEETEQETPPPKRRARK